MLHRFWTKVDASGDCWEWTAGRSRGYPQFWLDGRNRYSHRVVWELMVGTIPDGYEVDHLCRNKGCVNPDHLEPVSLVENHRRVPSRERRKTRIMCRKGLHLMVGENRQLAGAKKVPVCRECRRKARREYERERRKKERMRNGA